MTGLRYAAGRQKENPKAKAKIKVKPKDVHHRHSLKEKENPKEKALTKVKVEKVKEDLHHLVNRATPEFEALFKETNTYPVGPELNREEDHRQAKQINLLASITTMESVQKGPTAIFGILTIASTTSKENVQRETNAYFIIATKMEISSMGIWPMEHNNPSRTSKGSHQHRRKGREDQKQKRSLQLQ